MGSHLKTKASKGMALSAPASLYAGLVAAPLGILVVYSFWNKTPAIMMNDVDKGMLKIT